MTATFTNSFSADALSDSNVQHLQGSDLMEKCDSDHLTISLAGSFRLCAGDIAIPIASVMSRRLLAILCRSERMCRSRAGLQMLLWEDKIVDPAASLRQLLLQTRKRLGVFGSCLQTGADSIWLDNVTDETDCASGPKVDFFEDAGFGTDEFEDWLRFERLAFRTQSGERKKTENRSARDRRLLVGLATPGEVLLDSRQTVVAEWVSNLFRDALGWSDFICCTDLRLREEPPNCDLMICVHVLPVGGSFEISIALNDAGRCLWSRSLQVSNGKDLAGHRDKILEFAQMTVSRIEGLLPTLVQCEGLLPTLVQCEGPPIKQEPQLFHIIERLFTMRPADVRWAAEMLDGFGDNENLAGVLAWQGFSKMLMNGERLVDDRATARSEAMSLIQTALDVDPMNATALTVASHYQAFIMRDLAYARDLSDEALSIAPFSPFARDVRATLELYDNDLAAALPHADIAVRLGRSGPLRHYLAATGIMIDSLSGSHDRAISSGRRLLFERPRFLPVLRHLIASLAVNGETKEAQTLVERVKRLDPDYGTEAMIADRYPLPSELSREFIITTLRKRGLWS